MADTTDLQTDIRNELIRAAMCRKLGRTFVSEFQGVNAELTYAKTFDDLADVARRHDGTGTIFAFSDTVAKVDQQLGKFMQELNNEDDGPPTGHICYSCNCDPCQCTDSGGK